MTGNMMTGQAGAHALSERGHDLYETPEVAVRALLKVEALPPEIWEPSCGRGAISKVLQSAGHIVHSTDIEDYGFGVGGRDFFLETKAPPGFDCIVTNPPFKLASKYAAHALTLVPRVALLLRLAFLEGVGRSPIMEGGALARVHVFKNRLPMMHRDGWPADQRIKSGAVAFAWFVWDKSHSGDTALRRISWEAA